MKFADAQRYQDIYPDDARPAECQLARERAVWRLEDGQAVLVGYRIYRAPGGAEPRIPGVTPRCEYGLEILVVLAFLVYVIESGSAWRGSPGRCGGATADGVIRGYIVGGGQGSIEDNGQMLFSSRGASLMG